jgi:hypothetical protein
MAQFILGYNEPNGELVEYASIVEADYESEE